MPVQTLTPQTRESSRAISQTVEFFRNRKLMRFVLIGLTTGVVLWLTGAEIALAVTAYLVLGVVIVIMAIDMLG